MKPEGAPFCRAEVSGVVPPFSAKLRMGCMVLREFIDVARKGAAEKVFAFLTMNDCHDITK